MANLQNLGPKTSLRHGSWRDTRPSLYSYRILDKTRDAWFRCESIFIITNKLREWNPVSTENFTSVSIKFEYTDPYKIRSLLSINFHT